MSPSLFDPIRIGDLDLANRIVMAPMTRLRAVGGAGIPNPLMAQYYAQRAAAGLIISEGVPVGPMAVGYRNVSGIWTEAQTEGWKQVTKAVHEAGGRIFMQLWHVGRVSDPVHLDGKLPVAPSAVAAEGHVNLVRPKRPFVVPRALGPEEVPDIVDEFRKGAANAQQAGFDGVEIHGANGYLLDQFLQDRTNLRDDEYGGSIEKRARLLLEATDAAVSVWGAERVGVHLAPRSDRPGMGDSDPLGTFGYVAAELGKRRIAFICAREHEGDDSIGGELKRIFGGVYIVNEGYTFESASAAISSGAAHAVAFGKPFIANPDLVERFRTGAALDELVQQTIYGEGAEGYVDYPAAADG